MKVALLWLAATVTLAGTVTTALPLLTATEVVLPAALFSDTVQLLLALLPSVIPVKPAGALRFNVNVWLLLLSVAVITAV